MNSFDIFLVVAPGLEHVLADEARAAGFAVTETTRGGVTLRGGWPEVWRANLVLRGPTRVLARLGEFLAFHPAQLDKRARKFPWGEVLRPDVPVSVEVTTRASKIYHAGAARDRIETALREELGVRISPDAPVRVMVRIDDNRVTVSADTSGEPLHRRGAKLAVGRAPMRETMAALFLRACGHVPGEPVLDPMCGSGTFVIEAAEIAAGLAAGRGRDFAFQHLATFDTGAWAAVKAAGSTLQAAAASVAGQRDAPATLPADLSADLSGAPLCLGSDRDDGAVRSAAANAARAGVAHLCRFERRAISDLARPEGPPGLVIVNPPYGARIGERRLLFGLYAALGEVMRTRFRGWRLGLVTSDEGLARATGLPLLPPGPPVAHGGLKVRLHRTGPLD